VSKQAKHKRTKAQSAASHKWAAAGRASQAAKRAVAQAAGQPTRTKRQTQASQRWAAAGRHAQARARQGLKPLPAKKRALAGGLAVCHLSVSAVAAVSQAACDFMILAEANEDTPCCAATALAYSLYVQTGIMASNEDVLALHKAAGGDDGALIPELLEIASSGFAGTRVARFWPLEDLDLPGSIAGLRLPGGSHAALVLSGAACVTWGRIAPLAGAEEAWWAEWEHGG
jgi:hypothetical protein